MEQRVFLLPLFGKYTLSFLHFQHLVNKELIFSVGSSLVKRETLAASASFKFETCRWDTHFFFFLQRNNPLNC